MIVARYALWLLFRFLSWLRYRVRVEGLEKLEGHEGPFLILPNHPAFIDPLLVITLLWPRMKPRPMLLEANFRSIFLRPIMSLLDAIRVPSMESYSTEAQQRARAAVDEVVAGLNEGHNHIMWPSGRAQRNGLEVLGSASGLTEILRKVDKVTVVRVRTRGLFGSMLSYAYKGAAPSLGESARSAILLLLANLLFFMPRRRVHITLDVVEKSDLPELKREVVNAWLEEWYNRPGREEPTFVPYHFLFGRRTYEFPPPAEHEKVDPSQIKSATRKAVNHILAEKLRDTHQLIEESDLEPDTTLDSLGLDSLARMDVTLLIERRFGFSADEVPLTVGQLWALAEGLGKKSPIKPPPDEWFRPAAEEHAIGIRGETIPHAFVEQALASRKDIAAADDIVGVLNYERLLTGALILARRLRRLPGKNVGLLLPASVSCELTLFGLQLADKVPVVINWTTGPANIRHAVNLTELTHVVTSRTFIHRTAIEIPNVTYYYLEDVLKSVGKVERLRTLLRVRWRPSRVRKKVPKLDPDQTAVILFTSGSEKAPKAVPLTHRNLISNQRMAIQTLKVNRNDSVLGFLPAFHSFGLAVTGLLPLLAGVRLVCHPDPTDATGLVRKISTYKPTLLGGTPTFMNSIFDRATPGALDSLRIIVVGAEKCPPSLFDRARELAPNAVMLEGYGITECSPIISVNRPDNHRPGSIGLPLPGLDTAIVDLESNGQLPDGERGMFLVSGPSVFPGYLSHEGEPPFVEREGKRWYVTGDLVRKDEEGFLHFEGRLKRFLKAGGEMISLPALEEPFAQLYPPTEDGPQVAVEGVETENGRHIVLFTTQPITLHEANSMLMNEGFYGVMRLTEVRKVESIPVLGTGKTDYKVLRRMVDEGEK